MNTLQKRAAAAAIAITLAAGAGTAQAALVDRGGGMVYDSVLDITWLVDWNQSFNSGHDADGRMSWWAANDWADNLTHGGFDDWRLPVIAQPDPSCSLVAPDAGFGPQHYGYGCTGGELGHLFYVDLAALAGQPVTSGSNAGALALFSGMQLDAYWTRNEAEQTPVNAWYFNTTDGGQFTADKSATFAAVAVRPGDVVAAAVPEPGSLALALLALFGAAWQRGAWGRRP